MGKANFTSTEKTYSNYIALSHIFGQNGRMAKKIKTENSLPLWIYIFTTGMLVGVMIGVYSCIKFPSY